MQLERWERQTLLALYDLERDGVSRSTEQDLGARLGYHYIEEFEHDAPEIEHAVRTLQRFGLLDLDNSGLRITKGGRDMAMHLRGHTQPAQTKMNVVRVHAYGSPEVLF